MLANLNKATAKNSGSLSGRGIVVNPGDKFCQQYGGKTLGGSVPNLFYFHSVYHYLYYYLLAFFIF